LDHLRVEATSGHAISLARPSRPGTSPDTLPHAPRRVGMTPELSAPSHAEAKRRDDVPTGDSHAVCIAGCVVVGVVVEEVSVVCELPGGLRDRLGRIEARGDGDAAPGGKRGPSLRAGAGARRGRALIPVEKIE